MVVGPTEEVIHSWDGDERLVGTVAAPSARELVVRMIEPIPGLSLRWRVPSTGDLAPPALDAEGRLTPWSRRRARVLLRQLHRQARAFERAAAALEGPARARWRDLVAEPGAAEDLTDDAVCAERAVLRRQLEEGLSGASFRARIRDVRQRNRALHGRHRRLLDGVAADLAERTGGARADRELLGQLMRRAGWETPACDRCFPTSARQAGSGA